MRNHPRPRSRPAVSACLPAAVAALMLGAGCGDDLDRETLVGTPCEKSSECDTGGGICVTTGEDGMCSLPCEVAGELQQQCPLDTLCDRAQVETDKATLQEMTLCLPACKEQSDCRAGYSCNGVSDGPGKVCHPKPQ